MPTRTNWKRRNCILYHQCVTVLKRIYWNLSLDFGKPSLHLWRLRPVVKKMSTEQVTNFPNLSLIPDIFLLNSHCSKLNSPLHGFCDLI